ncbi:transposase [Exiguobacterium sp. N4-1P]|uniref:transposase n=1 Tax=Exiguobacterium sp. N4-1P TaxID=2051906 RepID=UPI0012FFD28C
MPGNVHDSIVFPALLQTVTQHFEQPFVVVADSAYKTVLIAHHLLKQGILPVFPYTRPRGGKEC